jgi:hypothetical protein
MLGLQYTLATVAQLIRARNADLPDAFIDKIQPIFESYKGPDRRENLIESLRMIRSASEEQRAASLQQSREPNAGITLRQYAIPLFATQIADLAICKP